MAGPLHIFFIASPFVLGLLRSRTIVLFLRFLFSRACWGAKMLRAENPLQRWRAPREERWRRAPTEERRRPSPRRAPQRRRSLATHGPPLSWRWCAASFTAARGLSGSRGGRAQRSDSQRSGGAAHGIEQSSDSTRAQRRRISACEARPRVLRRGGARGLPGALGRRRARTGCGISGAAAPRDLEAAAREARPRELHRGGELRARPDRRSSRWGWLLRAGVRSGPAAGDPGTTRSAC